jgi:hypothetical protein
LLKKTRMEEENFNNVIKNFSKKVVEKVNAEENNYDAQEAVEQLLEDICRLAVVKFVSKTKNIEKRII